MPVAHSSSSFKRKHKKQSPAPEKCHEATDEAPPDTLLATWSEVFPLSHGPAHRVRLHTGPQTSPELVAAITADYLRDLSERVSGGCRLSADGDLFGQRDFDGAPRDVLFAAVFATDLDAIVSRTSPSMSGGPSDQEVQ